MARLTVPDWLRQRADLTPARTALMVASATWTFAELNAVVDSAACALTDRVAPGERVAIRAANGPGYVVAVHALMRLGAVIVPINIRLSDAEVAYQFADANVATVLTDADVEALLHVPSCPAPPRDYELEAPHSIVYTSGTTGRPKGAILTYGNHYASAVASALNLGLLTNDVWLACLPLFHVGGLSILLRSVICGMTAVVHPRFDPAEVNRSIDTQRVSIVSVVSTMLDRMLSLRDGDPYPPTLRCVLLGGGPAPLPLLERAAAMRVPVVQTYGLTETASQIATLAPEDALRKLGSAGKPLMGSRLRIADDGEIVVQGPTVSPGYLNHPPRQDAWLHTGDLGYMDVDGYLYVLDRRDDLIVSGGENVYPAEVEAVLLAHPGVAEAGVVGVPDAQWGRRVTGFVVRAHGVTLSQQDLIAFCRTRLAGYKVPREIEFRDTLPRTAAGKLLRRELRAER